MDRMCQRVTEHTVKRKDRPHEFWPQIDHVRICHLFLCISESLSHEQHADPLTLHDSRDDATDTASGDINKLGSGRRGLPPYWNRLWASLEKAIEHNYKTQTWTCKFVTRDWVTPEYKPKSPQAIYNEHIPIAEDCLQMMAKLDEEWPRVQGAEHPPPSLFPEALRKNLRLFTGPCPKDAPSPQPAETATSSDKAVAGSASSTSSGTASPLATPASSKTSTSDPSVTVPSAKASS